MNKKKKKLFRLLRQAELHSQTIALQLEIISLRSTITRDAISDFEKGVAVAAGFAATHTSMLDQTRAAMLAMVEGE